MKWRCTKDLFMHPEEVGYDESKYKCFTKGKTYKEGIDEHEGEDGLCLIDDAHEVHYTGDWIKYFKEAKNAR